MLGFLDLYQLSLHSYQRRKQVFSLNPNGQPHIWNDICNECIKVIRTLTISISVGKKGVDTAPSSSDAQTKASEQFTSYGSLPHNEGIV